MRRTTPYPRTACRYGSVLIAASAMLAASIQRTVAQTTWTGGVGDWFSPINWSAGVPNSASPTSFDAQINNGGIAQIFAVGASVRRITLGTLNGQAGGLLADAGTLNVTENLRLGESGGMGTITIRNNARVNAGVTILGVFSGSGTMTVSGAGSALVSQTLILGELASGTMVVRDGADVSGFHISLANASSSAFGRMTVTGTGSTLVADNTLWVGRTGAGELTVDGGGSVSTPTLDIGSNTSGSGTVLVSGAGSVLTASNTLLVGNNGFGGLTIADGGRVNSIALALGFAGGATGTVTVTGAGSRLVDTFNSIHIGEAGSGTLTIADGGAVTINNGFGSVVVGATAGGFASALRIGSGAAPGTLEAGSISLFRANSKLELNHTGVATLGMPISGPGAVNHFGTGTTRLLANNTFSGPVTVSGGVMEISAGGRVNNASDSNVAVGPGQVAALRINGLGSKWINTASTFIGSDGTGTVTVENGGELRSDVQLLVNRFSTGNGTLTVTGVGSKAITNGELRIADEGIGLMRVEAGGAITSSYAELARQATGNATAIVSGTGSTWSIASDLVAGGRGMANLQIASGGKLTSTGGSYLGLVSGAKATAAIEGPGSVWDMSFLQVGGAGTANLNISGGASLITRLSGGNSVSVGEQAGGIGSVTATGVGTTWTNPGGVVVGNLGSGTVLVQSGATVTSARAAIAFQPGSTSSVTVDGVGSRWEVGAGTFIVGGKFVGSGGGNGTLNITSGGVVTVGTEPLGSFNGSGLIGFQAGATGTVNVSGTGSLWNPKYLIEVGGQGIGTMNITAGGRVETDGTFIGTFAGSVGAVTVSGAGSMLMDTFGVEVGVEGTGILTIADGGIVNVISGTGPVNVGSQAGAGPSALRIGSGAAPGTLQAGSVSLKKADALLEFNHTGDHAFGAIPISGPGSVSKAGVGATTFPESATILSANSTYSGGTNIDGGTLRVTNPNGMGLGTGPVNVNPSNTIVSRVLNFAQNGVAGGNAVNVFPVPSGNVYGGKVTFTDNASAGVGQFSAVGGTSPVVLDAATIEFLDSSTASTATFVNHGGTASAGRGGETRFGGNSTAGGAVFTNHGGAVAGATFGYTAFDTPGASAGTASFMNLGTATREYRGFNNGGHLYVFQGTAANANVTNAAASGANGSSGRTHFGSTFAGATAASGGSAMIENRGANVSGAEGGTTTFSGISNAGSAQITNRTGLVFGAHAGTTEFRENSSVGSATIITEGSTIAGDFGATTTVSGNASGGTATFINQGPTADSFAYGGHLVFEGNSSAQSAMITNRAATVAGSFQSATFFVDSATAGDSTIINEGGIVANGAGGVTIFAGANASAGNANIIAKGGSAPGAQGGEIVFFGNTLASATLTALAGTNGGMGGFINFQGGDDAGNASANVEENAALSIVFVNASTRLGSIAGSGIVSLGNKELVVGGNDLSTVFSGSINGTSTSGLTKVGTGTLTLSGTNTAFAGTTFVGAGRLQVDSGLPGDVIAGGGSLAGIGPLNGSTRIGAFSGPTQAFLDPGATIGTMTINGALSFTGFGTLRLELNSATQQADLIVATGSVGLAGIGNANLIALELGVGQFPMGIPFTILDKQSAGAISGVFAGLPEGALLDIGANRFRISYVGGNGNDITLTNTIPEPGAAVLAIAASILLLLRRKPQSASEPHAEND